MNSHPTLREDIILFIFTLLLATVVVGLIIYTTWLSRNKVNASSIPVKRGDFAVKVNTDYNSILSTCGSDGKSQCILTNVTYLSIAIDFCLSKQCSFFTYSSIRQVVKLISSMDTPLLSNGVDTYIKQ